MLTTTCPLRMSRPFRGGASTPFAISSHMFKARPLVGRGEMQDKQHMSSPSGTEHGTSHPQDHAGVQVIERTCNRAAVERRRLRSANLEGLALLESVQCRPRRHSAGTS